MNYSMTRFALPSFQAAHRNHCSQHPTSHALIIVIIGPIRCSTSPIYQAENGQLRRSRVIHAWSDIIATGWQVLNLLTPPPPPPKATTSGTKKTVI